MDWLPLFLPNELCGPSSNNHLGSGVHGGIGVGDVGRDAGDVHHAASRLAQVLHAILN